MCILVLYVYIFICIRYSVVQPQDNYYYYYYYITAHWLVKSVKETINVAASQ